MTEDVGGKACVEKSGLVTLADLGAMRTRVAVSIDHEGDAGAEEAVGAHLDRDLAELKRFAETRG